MYSSKDLPGNNFCWLHYHLLRYAFHENHILANRGSEGNSKLLHVMWSVSLRIMTSMDVLVEDTQAKHGIKKAWISSLRLLYLPLYIYQPGT